LSALDRWASKQSDKPTRAEAIRRLVELGLAGSTKTPARRSEKNTAKAKELAAEAIDRLVDPKAPAEEKASRKLRLLRGPEEFREARVDLANATGK
jgi:hypothetical protein